MAYRWLLIKILIRKGLTRRSVVLNSEHAVFLTAGRESGQFRFGLHLFFRALAHKNENQLKKGGRFMKKILLAALVVLMIFSAAPAMAERSGGTLNYMAPYGGDLFGLDPHKSSRYQDFLVSMNIHRSLYKWDAQKNEPVLDLAENVSISDDSLVYTYKLRPNIKFHNGRQLTADDVIWSYTRIASMQPASPQLDNVKIIKGVAEVSDGKATAISGLKKIDDLSFEMTLVNPVDAGFTYGFRVWTFCRKRKWSGWETLSPPSPWDAALSSSSNG